MADLDQIKQDFIQGAGNIAASLIGVLNRVCGQIYALLFLSPTPLSLDDIVEELQVSKGSVSINIRILEDFKLVKKVWVKGSRKDFYEAVDELPKAVVKVFFDKIRRNIQDSMDMICDCHDSAAQIEKKTKGHGRDEVAFMVKRLERIRSFYQNAGLLFSALYEGQPLNTSLIKPILEK